MEGQIVSRVCVKGLNNNVNSFCTVVEKRTFFDSMMDISDYNTNTSLCSNLATMVLKIVHYMNVVSSRHMVM